MTNNIDPDDRYRLLARERRTQIGAPEDRTNADLRAVIHILAQMMNEPRRAA